MGSVKGATILAFLQLIQSFVQQTATVIASVLEVEVVIVDEQLKVVAGTGYYRDSVGRFLSTESISARVIETNQHIIITNPRKHVFCQHCSRRDSCPDTAEICIPITMKNEVIGVLVLVAFNDEQKMTILNQQKKLVDFVARISDLLSMAISSRLLADKLDYMATEYETVINSVKDGIIAIDKAGIIVQVNNPALHMLKDSRSNLVGKPAVELFADPVFSEALRKRKVFVGKEIYSIQGGKKNYYLTNLTHITDNGSSDIKGYVLVIRHISEVGQIVGRYLSYERHVGFDDIKCVSGVMVSVKENAMKVAKSDSTVLIQGESGTGKELFARAIHYASLRSDGPFVALNCGAIPETLLESELFGYEEGAFSGAKRGGKAGRLELGNKGTVFLDEIGDLPLHLQVKLLRIFENKVVDRVGGVKPIPIDIRIIAATHKDLQAMVAMGEFRLDLYYRISVIPLLIPPLRDRREDIELYIEYFISKFNAIMGKNIKGCSPATSSKLKRWDWPGNVRELENAIEYAINMETTDFIQSKSLPSRFQEERPLPGNMAMAQKEIVSLKQLERRAIIEALGYYGCSAKGKAAICECLGIGIATFYRKLREYEIRLEAFDPPKQLSD
jgi:PAS domain S-box-containing protein